MVGAGLACMTDANNILPVFMGSMIMAKILQETDTFLLHHTSPTRTPNKELLQTVFKGSFSLCQLLLSHAGKGGSTLLYAIPRRVGHKIRIPLKPKNNKL